MEIGNHPEILPPYGYEQVVQLEGGLLLLDYALDNNTSKRNV
jgi:hypothetical protein